MRGKLVDARNSLEHEEKLIKWQVVSLIKNSVSSQFPMNSLDIRIKDGVIG